MLVNRKVSASGSDDSDLQKDALKQLEQLSQMFGELSEEFVFFFSNNNFYLAINIHFELQWTH